MTAIRRLHDLDVHRLHEIDVSEHISVVFRLRDGGLVSEAHDSRRPRWDEAAWRERVAEWRETLKPDVWLGAFAGTRLGGMASLRYGLSPEMAQLTTLHVSQDFRRRGVARDLLRKVIEMARESHAKRLYVSATPSGSAVGFYLSEGFRVTKEPDPRMYELEPQDIHMIRGI
jgi:GNAT superfamily N-acetyltransferase